jgi:hypothetical protein
MFTWVVGIEVGLDRNEEAAKITSWSDIRGHWLARVGCDTDVIHDEEDVAVDARDGFTTLLLLPVSEVPTEKWSALISSRRRNDSLLCGLNVSFSNPQFSTVFPLHRCFTSDILYSHHTFTPLTHISFHAL